jgi:hypothetical protein
MLIARVDMGITSPAYTAAPKETVEDKLGLGAGGYETKEERLLAAYKKYQGNMELCTVREIAAAKEYMYLNDMLTAEEEQAYETSYGD